MGDVDKHATYKTEAPLPTITTHIVVGRLNRGRGAVEKRNGHRGGGGG